MAGYNGFSKSNNAVNAEAGGLYPLTQAARELVKLNPSLKLWQARAILKLYGPSEWHHTSGWYNKTDYYNTEAANEALAEGEIIPPTEKPKQKSESFRAKVTWLGWGGTRKHPRATEYSDTATLTLKGSTFTVESDNHGTFKKRESTRGFSYTKLEA